MHLSTLLLQIGAILLLGRLLGRMFRRIGQPVVIAEIVAGIALGPSILGAISPDAMAALFPPASLPGLGLVAQLGLVFYMFLVGLEFDPKLLRGQLRASIAVSNAGIVVPLALGIGLATVIYADMAPEGVRLLPFALFLGVAMSVTAFPVLARILAERRLIRTKIGSLALASAAVDDVTAWCLLALVVGIANADGIQGALITTALALAYSAVIWTVVRPILGRLGPRGGSAISTEVFALVLMVVVGSAIATEWIGIHALFGAFLVGAAMPRHGDVPTVLAEKMEDFVTVGLLPLFFAYSGLRTQIGLLHGAHDWGWTLIIILVATAGKFGGTAIVGRLTGLPAREANALGILMNTRGLMELVVLNVGLDLGVISDRLFAMMVIMALVTTFITSPLLALLYPDSETLPAEATAPTDSPREREVVLICVSDPVAAAPLVYLASIIGRGGSIHALHLTPTERPQDYLRDEATEEVAPPLEAVSDAATARGVQLETIEFPSANPAADITRVSALKSATTTLIGVHRSSLGRDSLGGVVAHLLRDCPGALGILVDRGLPEVKRVAIVAPEGPDGNPTRRLAAHFVAAGASIVPIDQADLVVADCDGARLSADGGPSWLLVRG